MPRIAFTRSGRVREAFRLSADGLDTTGVASSRRPCPEENTNADKNVVILTVIVAFAATLSTGCNQSTQVPLAPAPRVEETPPKELPKDRKGGGSGNMKRNPGGNT